MAPEERPDAFNNDPDVNPFDVIGCTHNVVDLISDIERECVTHLDHVREKHGVDAETQAKWQLRDTLHHIDHLLREYSNGQFDASHPVAKATVIACVMHLTGPALGLLESGYTRQVGQKIIEPICAALVEAVIVSPDLPPTAPRPVRPKWSTVEDIKAEKPEGPPQFGPFNPN